MVDYSKWKNIEISDDEDDTHPNIDTPSLFRWRHQARVERMEQHEKDMEKLKKTRLEQEKKVKETKQKIASNASNMDELKIELERLEKEEKRLKAEEEELQKKEKVMPWNVDTISKPGFAKTVINSRPPPQKDESLSEEEREARLNKFINDHEKELKHYGMLRRYEDSCVYLKAHNYLVSENTANYLVIWCINLQMSNKTELMSHVAHQVICMQYILELAKQLSCDPRACLDAFFSKIQIAEPEYRASFQDELEQFINRIKRRAAEKMEVLVAEAEEEERQARLGPGGLDPVEVFETLPDALKKCFESQDVQLLQTTLAAMDEQDAKYHMKRAVDSGLWLLDGNKEKKEEEKADEEKEAAGTSSS